LFIIRIKIILFSLFCFYLDSFAFDLDFKSNEIIFKTNAKPILKEKRKVYYFSIYDFDENMADDEDDDGKNLNN